MKRRFSVLNDEEQTDHNKTLGSLNNTRKYKFKHIKVVEPAWVGDTVTGHRTYRVISETSNDFMKVIRRYSQFEALRNILIANYSECIIPILPPKTYTEKITSDESDSVNKRMRGLKRFLEAVQSHSEMSQCEDFIKFLRDSDFPIEFLTKDSNDLEEDTSTISKYMYSFLKVVKSKVSGSTEVSPFKSKSDIDFNLDKDYQRLLSLREFTEKLHQNGEKLKQLFSDETENLRSFRTFVSKLDSNVKSIDVDLSSSLDEEVNKYRYDEEEKNIYTRDLQKREIKDSVDMINSESSISNQIYNIVILIEEGIDMISSAIDSIDRRNRYKCILDSTIDELNELNNSSNDPDRQKEIINDKITTLKTRLNKIDNNLVNEIQTCFKIIDKNTIKYVDELIKIRRTHLSNQKENWNKISLIASESIE